MYRCRPLLPAPHSLLLYLVSILTAGIYTVLRLAPLNAKPAFEHDKVLPTSSSFSPFANVNNCDSCSAIKKQVWVEPPKPGKKHTRIHESFVEATSECFRCSVAIRAMRFNRTGLIILLHKGLCEGRCRKLTKTSQGIYCWLLVDCVQKELLFSCLHLLHVS